MRIIVHLSDLHFGRVDPEIVTPVLDLIRAQQPDLVAISGDLTQRARTAEYLAAREFLREIPFPQIVVPGNHDVPLHNLVARFTRRLDRYQRYITQDLQPSYIDEEIAVIGVNTARALTWKDGRINRRQLARLRKGFRGIGSERLKIVVTHHPFDLPAGTSGRVVGRSRLALRTLADCRVDMLLAGHFHIADTGQTATRYHIPGYSALIVSSGTSTSTRQRGQANSLNVIRVENSRLSIERYLWESEVTLFHIESVEHFERSNEGWTRA